MPLPGVCPSCGARFDLAAALTDADARQALVAALDVPAPLARLVVAYTGLHAPAGRTVAWPKLARLLRELADLMASGEVTRARETRAAPLALWQTALETVLAARDAGTLDLPLKGHGLLAEIAFRRAGKAAAGQAAAERPLHPSHRPAAADPAARNAAGLAHIGDLAARLAKGSRDA